MSLLLAGPLLLPWPVAGQEEPADAPDPIVQTDPGGPGALLLERYTVEPLSDAVFLRPIEESPAIRSVELTDEGQVLVNGKEFDRDELEGFLGEDGRLLAELAGMDPDERRAALGFEPEIERTDESVRAEAGEAADRSERDRRTRRVRRSADDRVSVGRSIRIDEDETVGAAVCVGCSVTVDGVVLEDAVAVGGSVRVSGRVEGQAVAVGGSVGVADGAEVGDDAVAIGGAVEVEEGGHTGGQRTSIGIGSALFGGWGDGWNFPFDVFGDVGELVAAIFRTGVLALLGVLVLLVARGAVDNGVRRMTEEPWKAVFAGLLVQLFFLPILIVVTFVLAVSVIGIPLLVLVPVALLALVIAALFGFVAVGRVVGDWAEQRFGARFSSDILSVVVGIVLIQAISLVGRAVSLPGVGWLAIVGFSIVALGFFMKYLAWTVGMGAMTLVAFGRDWRRPLPQRSRPEREPEPDLGSLGSEPDPDREEPPI
ncbi:MAG TPA: hypothetical protein VLA66_04440 [Thermoanaerobaculia bacterium]|nr:hypothetical protein [Thermoanaerobaculia bacterium]